LYHNASFSKSKKVGSSLYKKHTTSSFFGLLEGITLTGAVVIGVGGVIVHSVYALYTGEPTLLDFLTANTGPIFTQPAQPTAAIPAPEPAPVPVTETLSVWTRFKNWWMGMHPNTVKKNKQEKLQELDDALQSSIDDFFKKEKENAEIRENVKNYVDWYVSTMLIENPDIDIKENPSKLAELKNLLLYPENLEFAYVLAVLLVKAEENQYSTLPEQEAFLLKIQKEWKEIEKKKMRWIIK
jgi:6-pyruvoyl-tetrahydropterin synthase